MNSETSTDNPETVGQAKQQLDILVDEISQLAKQDLEPDKYYAEFLGRAVEALAAVGGAIWGVSDQGQLEVVSQINLEKTLLDQPGEHQKRHASLLTEVFQAGEGVLVPPCSGTRGDSDGANPTELLLILAPIRIEEHIDCIVEIFQRPAAQLVTRRGYLTFLKQVCDLSGEWLKNRKLRELTTRESMWRKVDNFSRVLHETLNVDLCAFAIANEAQKLIGCDRVSVAIQRGSRCRIAAVSGQETIDQRSNLVQLLNQLATKVVSAGEPIWYTGARQEMLPQIEEAIQAYVDESFSKTVVVVPLERLSETHDSIENGEPEHRKHEEQIGALIFEQIVDDQSQQSLEPRIELVKQHSARALSNAIAHNDLFLMPIWRALGKTRWLVRAKTLPKTIAAIAGVILLLSFLCFFPARFDLKGQGVLKPVVQRNVFVSSDGIVQEVLVQHGEWVEKGQILVKLSNTDLDVQMAELLGQTRSAQEQLTSVQRMRHDPKLPLNERTRLGGQSLQISQRLASLQSQTKLLKEKAKRLTIRSPIHGEIVTWDLQRQLLHRPVSSGEILLTVADPSGAWEMEVFMPENRMGHIACGQDDLGLNLDVRYIVATNPTEQQEGKVKEIHSLAQLHEEHGHAISILVVVKKEDLQSPRPGTSVTAKVHCGYRSLGYVWFHDVFEFVQSKILFHF